MRRAFIAIIGTVLATSSAATAAPRYCHVLTDPRGDAQTSFTDIVGGDIATGKTELVAVLRLASTQRPDDLLSQLDWYDWSIGATLNGVDYSFSRYQPWGVGGGAAEVGASVGNTRPPVKFRIVGNEFQWILQRKDLPSLNKKPGQRFTQLHATTSLNGSTDDTAVSPRTKFYPDKAPSCVKAR